MTEDFLYTVLMFTSVLLISAPLKGSLLFILFFLLSFVGVHLTKLVRFGWKNVQPKKQTPAPKPQESPKEQAPTKTQEPVYYVIERKRKKPKTTYSEPRQITFK